MSSESSEFFDFDNDRMDDEDEDMLFEGRDFDVPNINEPDYDVWRTITDDNTWMMTTDWMIRRTG